MPTSKRVSASTAARQRAIQAEADRKQKAKPKESTAAAVTTSSAKDVAAGGGWPGIMSPCPA